MTGFDILLVAIIVASTLLALVHGFIKEIISIVAWVLGVGFALLFTNIVGHWLPENLFGFPHLRYVVAFVGILIVVLLAGATLSALLKSGAKAIGLGALDRVMGGLFGVARGVLIAMVLVLVISSTTYAREAWYQQSMMVPHLRIGAELVRAQLPSDWAMYLDNTLHPPPLQLAPPPAGVRQKA